jgi:hypothetical protein
MLVGSVGKRCRPAPESAPLDHRAAGRARHDCGDLQTSGLRKLPVFIAPAPCRRRERIVPSTGLARIYRCNRFRRKLFS